MPDKWTAEQHERLLFVLIDQYKLPTKDIAAGWKKKYRRPCAVSRQAELLADIF
jgi:hypothetical protein